MASGFQTFMNLLRPQTGARMEIDNVATFVLVQVMTDVGEDFIAQRLAYDVDSIWELVLAGSGTIVSTIGEGVVEGLSYGIVLVDMVGLSVPVGRVTIRVGNVLF